MKGRCYEDGLALRRRLLIDAGLPAALVDGAPPRGAGADDLLDVRSPAPSLPGAFMRGGAAVSRSS